MSERASVDLNLDASDALLLWVDPLAADALDLAFSVDGFDAHTSLSARPAAFAARRSDLRHRAGVDRFSGREGGKRHGFSTSLRGRGEDAIKPTGEVSNS